ncbi:DUF2523 family protein [Acidithiobacillus ferruginosus]|uniref:DUF2523 family protein n=1 Tax=Acidithiobacillus ferruginosus TaxID=3063951 RepID=A0ACD5IGD9_9PROT|nr:DUF2523 family protein [Acidithiobacillus ferruginosus]MBU2814043.1 DUF2523 domain-containing protein [Acidithiobacillus ferruginosus]
MGAIISGFAAWLMSMLALLVAWGARYFLARLILSLGLGVMTITGITAGLSALESLIESSLTGTSSTMTWISSILGLMGFDSFVNIIFAAYLAKLSLKGLQQGGSISSFFIKGQG